MVSIVGAYKIQRAFDLVGRAFGKVLEINGRIIECDVIEVSEGFSCINPLDDDGVLNRIRYLPVVSVDLIFYSKGGLSGVVSAAYSFYSAVF